MLSRLIRGKPEPPQEYKPLRGMPALKQKRSSQRQEALMPRLASPTSALPPRPTQFGDGAAQQQHKPKTNTQVVANGSGVAETNEPKTRFRQQNGLMMERQPYKNPNRLSYQEQPANKTTPTSRQQEASARDPKQRSPPASNERTVQSSPTKKSDSKGRNLHSIKKVRKESRESAVSTSMRALTPRERESIRFLEEVIQQHDEWCLDDCEDTVEGEGSVFEDETFLGREDNTDSDTTSVGSIIDLVGNLSSSCSSPQMSDSRVSINSNQNNSVGSGRGVPDILGGPYGEDTYAEVDWRVVEKKRAARQQMETQALQEEPVYAAVKKTKKKKKESKSKKSSTKSDDSAFERQTNVTEEPTAKSSRIFWQKMSAKESPTEPPSPSALQDGRARFTPTSGLESRHVWSRSDSIEHVPGSSKNQFRVRPGKAKGSTSSRSSDGSFHSDNSGLGKHTMYLDISPNTPPPKGAAKRTPDTDSDADSGCPADPSMMAIPRQTVLSTSPNKPFVLTPAKRSVLSFS